MSPTDSSVERSLAVRHALRIVAVLSVVWPVVAAAALNVLLSNCIAPGDGDFTFESLTKGSTNRIL